MKHLSKSPEETENLAAALAPSLRGGQCLALYGDLGAGKTQFVRGLVKGLGGNIRMVSSPTFVLLNIYPTATLKVFHLDAYRIGGADDFEGIGFAELLAEGGIVVVEWAQKVEALLPADRVEVRIETLDPTRRELTIE